MKALVQSTSLRSPACNNAHSHMYEYMEVFL
jgi:hypothetical protein